MQNVVPTIREFYPSASEEIIVFLEEWANCKDNKKPFSGWTKLSGSKLAQMYNLAKIYAKAVKEIVENELEKTNYKGNHVSDY